MAQLSLEISDDLMLWLKRYARVNRRSVNEQVRVTLLEARARYGEIPDKDAVAAAIPKRKTK